MFDPEGTTTAGNAPGVNDGAGCVIVTSEEFARKRGLEVLATIVSQGYVADDFAFLARTPAKAGEIALAKAGKSIDDVERVELNEAFSSVVVNSMKMLGADPEKVNVNGGAVALGHPIGASGARIVGTMVHDLRRNGGGPRARGDLLRRRPGRRAAARGVTKLLVVLAVVALAVVAAPAASACSCIAPGTPRADLARSDGAFVGVYQGRYRLSASAFFYKFTIVRRVKGNLPARTIHVVAGTNSASCGLQVRKGQRVALLLQRSERQWRSSLCDQRAANFFRGVPSRLLASCG